MEECKNFFEQELAEIIQLPMNQADLDQLAQEVQTATLQKFKKNVSGDSEIVKEFQDMLGDYTCQRIEAINNENAVECRRFAAEMLQSLFLEFD